MTSYKKRELADYLLQCMNDMPVVVLTGMRQCGKSTLLTHEKVLQKRRYVSLDDFAQLEAAKTNPEAFLSGEEPITIDEAQKCPELFDVMKRMVDGKRKPGQFLLSGSANFSLLKGMSESLAGRAIYLGLHPFTLREISGRCNKDPFLIRFFRTLKIPTHELSCPSLNDAEILSGGMPTVSLGQVRHPSVWFKGYEQTYIERDLRALSQVANLISFRHLMHLVAFRTGQLLKTSELARDAKMNAVTTSRYLNLLETSFLVRRIEPFLSNRASRVIKSPKIYLADSGLACHLAGVTNLAPDANEPLRGAMFETYAAQNLAGILEARLPEARLMYWNVQGRHEVDFVIQPGKEVVAIEVKAATRWDRSDLSGLRAFLSATPACKAAILAYNGTEAVQIDPMIWVIPLSLILS